MWYLIVSIPDLCTLTYFDYPVGKELMQFIDTINEIVLRGECNVTFHHKVLLVLKELNGLKLHIL